MRFLLLLLLLETGCTPKTEHSDAESFTFIGVPERIRPEPHMTIDGKMQSMVIRVLEVKKGRYDQPTVGFDFDEGTDSPVKIGHHYLFVAEYGIHGIFYPKVTELKKEPNQAPDPTPPSGAGHL